MTTEYGEPIRNATDDANAGILNKETATRSFADLKVSPLRTGNPIETGEDSQNWDKLGSALAEPFGRILAGHQNEVDQESELAAQARQGFQLGVNEVDKANKRTGFIEALAGQNVSYKAAQVQGLKNTMDAIYIEDLQNSEKYAADTPEEFLKRKQDQLGKYIENYKDDPEAQRIIMDKYTDNTRTLAREHMKNHIAYAAQQTEETWTQHFLQKSDEFDILKDAAAGDPDVLKEYGEKATKEFTWNPSMDISKEGFYNAQSNAIEAALSNGHAGLYRAGLHIHGFDMMPHKNRVRIMQAASKYEEETHKIVQGAVDDMKDAVESDPSSVETIYQRSRLAIAQRDLGSEKSKYLINKLDVQANGIGRKRDKIEIDNNIQAYKNSMTGNRIFKHDEHGLFGLFNAENGGNWGVGLLSSKQGKGSYTKYDGDITQLSLRQVIKLQQAGVLNAAGGGQIIATTMPSAVEGSGVDLDAPMTVDNQKRLIANLVWKNDDVRAFLQGKGSVEKANDGMASLWAGFKGSSGSGKYDGVNGNKATMSAQTIQENLLEMRDIMMKDDGTHGDIIGLIAHAMNGGKPPELPPPEVLAKMDPKQVAEIYTAVEHEQNQRKKDFQDDIEGIELAAKVDAKIHDDPSKAKAIILQIERENPNATAEEKRILMKAELSLDGAIDAAETKKKTDKVEQDELQNAVDLQNAKQANRAGYSPGNLSIEVLPREKKEKVERLADVQEVIELAAANNVKLTAFGKSGAEPQAQDALRYLMENPVEQEKYLKRVMNSTKKNEIIGGLAQAMMLNIQGQVDPKTMDFMPEAKAAWAPLINIKDTAVIDRSLSEEDQVKLSIYANGINEGKTPKQIGDEWGEWVKNHKDAPGSLSVSKFDTGEKALSDRDAAEWLLKNNPTKDGTEQDKRFWNVLQESSTDVSRFNRLCKTGMQIKGNQQAGVEWAKQAMVKGNTVLNGHVVWGTQDLNWVKPTGINDGTTYSVEDVLNNSQDFMDSVVNEGVTEKNKLRSFKDMSINDVQYDNVTNQLMIHANNTIYVVSKEELAVYAADLHQKRIMMKNKPGNDFGQDWSGLSFTN